jgi:hypothetical protein
MKLLLQVALCTALMAGSASAVTITPTAAIDHVDAALHPLSNAGSQLYEYQSGPLALGAINLFFNFNALTNAVVTLTTGDQPNVGSNIANLMLTWLDTDGNAVPGGSVLVAPGSNPEVTLALALAGAGDYFLHVTGSVLKSGSNFNIAVSTTPIPPALVLFGSALAGLGFLGRRSRRSSASSPLA